MRSIDADEFINSLDKRKYTAMELVRLIEDTPTCDLMVDAPDEGMFIISGDAVIMNYNDWEKLMEDKCI